MHNREPLVTVVVPNYNHARFLPQRLDSILAQTFRYFEIIVLDDHSTDDSRAVIQRYADAAAADPDGIALRAAYNDTNSGNPFAQWQKGIAMARGQLVWIAESDDYADPRLLERLAAPMAADPTVAVAYCQSNFVDPEGEVFGCHIKNLRPLDPRRWETSFVVPGSELLSLYMPIINIIPNASAALFRRSLLRDADWREAMSYTLAGDRHFWATLMSRGKVAFEALTLNYFRFTPTTVRSNRSRTPLYLGEVSRVFAHIARLAPVGWPVRKKAARQWLQYARKAWQAAPSWRAKTAIGARAAQAAFRIAVVGKKR